DKVPYSKSQYVRNSRLPVSLLCRFPILLSSSFDSSLNCAYCTCSGPQLSLFRHTTNYGWGLPERHTRQAEPNLGGAQSHPVRLRNAQSDRNWRRRPIVLPDSPQI